MTLTAAEAEQQSRFLVKILHHRRMQLERTRNQVARVLNIDESTLVRWETKEDAHPKLDQLIAWANALELDCQIKMTPN